MTDDEDERRRRRRAALGAAGGLLVAAIMLGPLLFRVVGRNLLDLEPPGWLRWVGPTVGLGKLLFLAGLGVLAVLSVIGEWDRRRRSGQDETR